MSVINQDGTEVEVVTGTVTGIITKGADKWQVAVKADPSSQYSKNLWTKDADLIHQLQQLIGSAMTFQCGVSHWNMGDGTPVRSLWINGVGPAQHSVGVQNQQPGTQAVAQAMHPQQVFQQQQAQPVLPVQSGPQPQTWDDDPKQGKIHRQTASKVAGILLGYLPAEERTLDTLLTVSERLVAYYDNGMPQAEPAPGMNPDTGEFPPGW